MAQSKLQAKLNEVIFGTDTRAGKLFDVFLIVLILISVVAVLLDSVASVSARIGQWLYMAEWAFTLFFTAEYLTRLYCARHTWGYMRSFYGIVDLLAILPTYLVFMVQIENASFLLVVRVLRVLRIFRVLKLMRYITEANVLVRSLLSSRRKILVFFSIVLSVECIFGSLMFLIEGPENGFTSIPKSIYWAIVTVTTVGYGDITPQTILGQTVAAFAMMLGYAIIAVPTGIISAELFSEISRDRSERLCRNCSRGGHDIDAIHCKFCGANLNSQGPPVSAKMPDNAVDGQ